MTRLEPPPAIDLRRAALSVAVALVAGVVVVVAIGRFTGFAELADTLDDAQWQWLALCAAGQIAVFAGYAGVFRATVGFENGTTVPLRRSIEAVLASFGLTQVVASGGAAGLAFTYWVFRKLGFERRDASVRLIGMNTAVYLVFGVIGWLAALAALGGDDVPDAMALPWLLGVPVVLALAFWFTAPIRVARWAEDTGGWLHRALAVGVSAAAWTRRAVTSGTGRRLLGWGSLYWLGDLLSLWAGLRAFGSAPDLAALVVAYVTGYLAQLIPVPFVATGGVDAATTLTLSAVGVPIEVALLGVVAHRVFAFWLPIFPGLGFAAAVARRGGLAQTP